MGGEIGIKAIANAKVGEGRYGPSKLMPLGRYCSSFCFI